MKKKMHELEIGNVIVDGNERLTVTGNHAGFYIGSRLIDYRIDGKNLWLCRPNNFEATIVTETN